MLTTLLAFLFAIGLLVTVHEYGHYRAAKFFGVRVLTFSIGFGKPLLQWQSGGTQWQIAAVPLGGFVRMLGEDDEQPLSDQESQHAYNRQHPLRRMAIVAAGPLANLLLAWCLFSAALMVGMPALKPVVGSVRVDSVAEQSGLRSGDEIVRLGGMEVADWDDLRLSVLAAAGGKASLAVRSPSGGERELVLDMSRLTSNEMDAAILGRIGLTPMPLLNKIAEVTPDSVAAKAGLLVGDEIFAINELPIHRWEQLQAQVAKNPGRQIRLDVRRGDDLRVIYLVPQVVESEQGRVGRIGVGPQQDEIRFEQNKFSLQLALLPALVKGVEKTWTLTRMTLQMIGRMLTGGLSASNVSGPVGIASLAGQSASLGVAAYLQYLALVSLSLGVLNLLPVPVLDGGHLLYHSVELLRGRPLPENWQAIGQRVGVVLLAGLMLLALYNDIHRFIPGWG